MNEPIKNCARWVKKRREAGVARRCYILGRKQGRMMCFTARRIYGFEMVRWRITFCLRIHLYGRKICVKRHTYFYGGEKNNERKTAK
nr:MAG TPA: hypothetical protein [Caudoviricetes sp.]